MKRHLATARSVEYVDPFTATIPKLTAVSHKYSFIPTGTFIQDMTSLGYTLERTSSPRRGLGMHSMEFSNPKLPKIDGFEMRILATNSHDGTTAFNLNVQVLVQVCSNGLVAFQNDAESSTRIIHKGYTVDKVAAAVKAVNTKVGGILEEIRRLQSISVSPKQGAAFLTKAAELREVKPYELTDLAAVEYAEQATETGWNVFNRVQAKLIRGGFETENWIELENSAVPIRIPGRRAKEITAVKDRLRINRSLWQFAVEEFLLKTA